jgi:hypothetical protein
MFILEKLWREGIAPSDRYTRKGSEYHAILLRLCAEEDKVRKELTETGTAHFDAYQQAQNELSTVAEREVFIEAFRLGARLVLDIVGEYQGDFQSANE